MLNQQLRASTLIRQLWRLILRWRLWVLLALAYLLFQLPELLTGWPWYYEEIDDKLHLAITLFTIASLASSWNIVAGYAGQINLGHAAFFGIGSIVTREYWLTKEYPFNEAFLYGGGAAALAALIVGIPALRLKGIYFAIGTLALAEASRLTVGSMYPGVSRLPGPELRAYDLISRYDLSLKVLVATVLISYFLSHSKIGLGMKAIREDEAAARSIGISVFFHTLFAFVLSAFLAGLAGGTFAFYHLSYNQNYTFGPNWTFDAVLVTFIGGAGTLAGPLIGSSFFVLVRDYLAGTSELVDTHLILFGVIFILVVLILPGGLVDLSTRISRWVIRQTRRINSR
jgi:branched-chain amino acid transport system permease protein